MEKIHKKDFEALKVCATRSSADIILEEEEYEKGPLSQEQKRRLEKLGYIDWNEKSSKLYNGGFVLTKTGMVEFLKLKELWRKDITIILAIIATTISLISFLKAFGLIF